MTADSPRLYRIDAGVPFVDALARGMLNRLTREHPDDPLALPRSTVLVPTRRAVRALREAFLRASGGTPLLLPRMMPLGDLDEDELLIEAPDAMADDLPPVIGGVRRQLILARLVMKFGGLSWSTAPDAGQAAELAAELARLLDQMETEGVGFEGFAGLVPDRFADHWREVLKFLEIVSDYWPRELEAEGAIGPAERRNRLLAARAEAWAARPPEGWVVAAGSTGSIPATADLLAVVARLERGCVVLPGLDCDLDDETWDDLRKDHPHHPQFGLARLLDHLGAERRDVRPFGADWPHGLEPAAPAARARLLSAAMSPGPRSRKARVGKALDGVALAACPHPAAEAATIALRMRGVLEEAGRTAALVTPDRGLARRVAARLRRWGIEVDDSAGTPLTATEAGGFLRLMAQLVAEDFAPLAVLACFKHPLAAGGMAPARFRARVRALEVHVLRGPRPAPGLGGLGRRLDAALEAAEGEARQEIEALRGWVADLRGRLAPLVDAMRGRPRPLGEIVGAHVAAAESLAASADESGTERLWRGEDGEVLATFLAEVLESGAALPPITGDRYPALLSALMAGRVVRPRWSRHPRLFIWGPLEARLQHADVVILGGLNEGTWPPEPGNDPWLSRPMRKDLRLPPPERRIGLAAHDFAQAFAAPEVLLTRAEREEGTPTVPSRWLLRLANALTEGEWDLLLARGAAWRDRAQALDEPEADGEPPARPRPAPPVHARPRRLSVTEIETLQVNPYAIYAKRILGLRRLDDIDADAGAAERGEFTHRALQIFLETWRETLPSNDPDRVAETLLEIGRKVFQPVAATPGLYAFWWPRFERVARWFAAREIAHRAAVEPLAAEIRGEVTIDAPAGPFTLTGIADRVDRDRNGRGLAIIDYKTGAHPPRKDEIAGFAPQLPLLAAIAEKGGFPGLEPAPVTGLACWRLSGGDPAGEARDFAVNAGAAAEDALKGLATLIACFDDRDRPYAPRPVAGRVPRFDDYAHLARVQEWSSAEESGEDGGE